MKRIVIVAAVLLVSIETYSTTIPLDSIRRSLVSFLSKVDHLNYSTDDLPDFLIVDRGKREDIKEGKDGVFAFGTLTSDVGIRPHFLLIDRDSFQILNMREPIDVNVLKLIQFFERNKEQYSRDEILFYMKNLIDIYQDYEAYIKSRGEAIP
jgi:hypothetical protein